MKLPILSLCVVLAIFTTACGWFDSEIATITYEEAIPIELTINADNLCPTGADCSGNAEPTPEDVELALIRQAVAIDIVAATGNSELRDIARRLRSMEITSIDYSVANNDLTFDLPELELYVTPLTTENHEAQSSVHLTTLPSVEAATDLSESVETREEALEPASDLFKTLEFNSIPVAQPVVKQGQPFPPSGSADLEIIVNIKIEANPLDSIN